MAMYHVEEVEAEEGAVDEGTTEVAIEVAVITEVVIEVVVDITTKTDRFSIRKKEL